MYIYSLYCYIPSIGRTVATAGFSPPRGATAANTSSRPDRVKFWTDVHFKVYDRYFGIFDLQFESAALYIGLGPVSRLSRLIIRFTPPASGFQAVRVWLQTDISSEKTDLTL